MYYSQDTSGKGKGGRGYRKNYRNNGDDPDSKANDSSRHNVFSHRHQRRDLEDDFSKGCSSKGSSQDDSSKGGGPQLISSGDVAPVMCPKNPCTSSPSLLSSSVCDEGYGAMVCVPREVVFKKVDGKGHLVDVCISSEDVQEALDHGGSCGPCPSLVSSSEDTRIRWRCAYPGEIVQVTDISETIFNVQKKSWLKGRSSATIEDEVYVLPGDHSLCKNMTFICPDRCKDNPDYKCQEVFTCKYHAPPSLTVSSPASEKEQKEGPSGQKWLPSRPSSIFSSGKGKGKDDISSSSSGKGKGKGKGAISSSSSGKGTSKGSSGRGKGKGKGGSASTYRVRAVDANVGLVVGEDEGHAPQDSFDEPPRSLQGDSKGNGNSKGTAESPTPSPFGPQLTSAGVQPKYECASTNYQMLPDDYYICSHLEPSPDVGCPKEMPENDRDYDALVDDLPTRCKEPEDDAANLAKVSTLCYFSLSN